jgi:hypothetical protein
VGLVGVGRKRPFGFLGSTRQLKENGSGNAGTRVLSVSNRTARSVDRGHFLTSRAAQRTSRHKWAAPGTVHRGRPLDGAAKTISPLHGHSVGGPGSLAVAADLAHHAPMHHNRSVDHGYVPVHRNRSVDYGSMHDNNRLLHHGLNVRSGRGVR